MTKSLTMLKCLLLAIAVTQSFGNSHNPSSSSILDIEEFIGKMNIHFMEFTEPRHPRNETREAWNMSRAVVKREMEIIGLEVTEQHFNTSVKFDADHKEEVEGCNIIGITKGSDPFSRMIVVGAHYDSSGNAGNNYPLRDNGVGIATLLEVARAFEESVRWKGYEKNYTTIFVAFDLNTKEQSPTSPGKPGSYYFVHDWLTPLLLKHKTVLRGSFILDSIANYNTEENSQVLPADFKIIFPEPSQRIHNDSMRGNFLAGFSNKQSQILLKKFAGHYRRDRMARPYRFQELVPSQIDYFGTGQTLDMVSVQASFHFWTNQPALPSVLLTDTGLFRSLRAGELCTVDCGFSLFASPDRLQFIHQTYTSLTGTLLDEQTTYIGLTGGSNLPKASLLTLVLTVAVARCMAF